jgi:hypothetical protein
MFLWRYEGYGPLRRDEVYFGREVLTIKKKKNIYKTTQNTTPKKAKKRK